MPVHAVSVTHDARCVTPMARAQFLLPGSLLRCQSKRAVKPAASDGREAKRAARPKRNRLEPPRARATTRVRAR